MKRERVKGCSGRVNNSKRMSDRESNILSEREWEDERQ